MRNLYRCEDGELQQINQITQRFVDEDFIWFYKDKLIESIIEVNLQEDLAKSTRSTYTSNSNFSIGNRKSIGNHV